MRAGMRCIHHVVDMTQWEAADALDMPQWEAVDMEQDESRELPLHPEMVAGKKMP